MTTTCEECKQEAYCTDVAGADDMSYNLCPPCVEEYDRLGKQADEERAEKDKILKKSLEKAINNGWKFNKKNKKIGDNWLWDIKDGRVYTWKKSSSTSHFWYWPKEVFFSHDFVKAFFGEEEVWKSNGLKPNDDYDHRIGYDTTPSWQYHRQQMELEKDYISYLKRFI